MKAVMKKPSPGFTIIEILIIVVVIGVLSTIGIMSFIRVQADSRDSQRLAKTTTISEALEKYYEEHGRYPTCATMTATDSNAVVDVLKGMDTSALTAPKASSGTNSITACTGDPTASTFIYYGGGSSFILKYKEEGTGEVKEIPSRHRTVQSDITQPSNPVIAVVAGSNPNVTATITPVTCVTGIAQYAVRTHTDSNAYSAYSNWNTITSFQQVATQGVKYYYQAQARCYFDSIGSTVATGDEAYDTANINAPATAPVVTASTVGATTTWSWLAVSCPVGTTTNYRYDYTYGPTPSWDSGWITPTDPTALSIDFTTSTGNLTYTVAVQAKCFNANGTSAWSAPGSADYFRPNYTLTTIAGTGGTVSGGGTYSSGATPTITATPNAYYSFTSWTGSTGCSGSASHTITIDANKSCTANFAPLPLTAPSTPYVTPPSTTTYSDNTRWSWSASGCSGSSIRYRYNFYQLYTTQSLIVTDATYSYFSTTYDNYTYKLEVQAQCYNAVTSSAWSSFGSGQWYNKIPPATTPVVSSYGASAGYGYFYWSGSYCPVLGDSLEYYYKYNYGVWTNSYGWNSVTEYVGKSYGVNSGTVYVQARCSNYNSGQAYSNWSNTASSTYYYYCWTTGGC